MHCPKLSALNLCRSGVDIRFINEKERSTSAVEGGISADRVNNLVTAG